VRSFPEATSPIRHSSEASRMPRGAGAWRAQWLRHRRPPAMPPRARRRSARVEVVLEAFEPPPLPVQIVYPDAALCRRACAVASTSCATGCARARGPSGTTLSVIPTPTPTPEAETNASPVGLCFRA
jgi:hypothetical protein